MFAKVFLFCAAVAAAKATSFYGSAVIAPRHLDSRQQDFMWTQGIMNPISASRSPFASVPVGTAAVTSAFATRSVPLSRSMISNANDPRSMMGNQNDPRSMMANPNDPRSMISSQNDPRSMISNQNDPRSMIGSPMSGQRSVQGTTGLYSGPSFMYSKGLLTNGIMGAASGIVSPMNAGLLVEPNVRNILK